MCFAVFALPIFRTLLAESKRIWYFVNIEICVFLCFYVIDSRETQVECLIIAQCIKDSLSHGSIFFLSIREFNQTLSQIIFLIFFWYSGSFWICPFDPLGEDVSEYLKNMAMNFLHIPALLEPNHAREHLFPFRLTITTPLPFRKIQHAHRIIVWNTVKSIIFGVLFRKFRFKSWINLIKECKTAFMFKIFQSCPTFHQARELIIVDHWH